MKSYTRLGFMLFLFFGVSACSLQNTRKYKKQKENYFMITYKQMAFNGCIRKGYKNDTIFQLMAKEDLFCSIEGVDFDYLQRAHQLGENVGKNIPKPFIKIEEEEDKNKKLICQSCLLFYTSKELQTSAKKEYKSFLQSEKEFLNSLDSIANENKKKNHKQ